jgi:dihydroflavonol-4-reductase
MKVFLTGGTGFIGQPLTQRLLGRGWEVSALVRKPDSAQARALSKLGAQCVAGDITDRESMRAGMTGADLVVHNAGWYELGLTAEAQRKMRAINVAGTEAVLGLAHELGTPRVVYVSSVVALGDTGQQLRDETFVREAAPLSVYEQTKTDAHSAALRCLQNGLPLIIVCPSQVVGPNDHSAWGYFARLYVNGLKPPVGWARGAIYSHVGVTDVAEGIALAAEKGRTGATYLLSGEPATMQTLMETWNSTAGRFKARLWLPTPLMTMTFALMEPLLRLMGLPAFMSREVARGADANFYYSNEKARGELGWRPRPVRELWLETMQGERELKAGRRKRDLKSRLMPVVEDV